MLGKSSHSSQAMMWETMEPPVLYLLIENKIRIEEKSFLASSRFVFSLPGLPALTTTLQNGQGGSVVHFIAMAAILTCWLLC